MKSFRWYRIFVIVKMAVKFFLQAYVLHGRWQSGNLQDAPERWERLLAKQAEEFRQTALRLEGLLIKVGQFLSTRDDILPRTFTNPLKDLVDRVPPAPVQTIKRTLQKTWNVPLNQVLRELPEQPVASASIADVYRASLLDGTIVAVKVRRPNVLRLFRADLAALRIVIRLVKRFTRWSDWFDVDALYRDFRKTTERELDFRLEQQQAQRFAKMLEKYQLPVRTPFIYSQWTTENTLVMEWLDGSPVTDRVWLEQHGVDRKQLIGQMIELFFVQVLEEGFFHADPHPGNLLVGTDGRLGIIDFGMTGEIRPETKKYFKQFLQGFVARDIVRMANAFEGLGFLRIGAQSLDLQKLIGTGMEYFLNQDFSTVDEQKMVGMLSFLREYVSANPLQLPAEFAFLGRSISMLSGVLAQIDPQIDYLEAVRPATDKWLGTRATDEDNQFANNFEGFGASLLDMFLKSGAGKWGAKGLSAFQTHAWPRIVEAANLPGKLSSYMESRKWNDFYARSQWQKLLLIGLLTTVASLFSFHHQYWSAAISGSLGLMMFCLYLRDNVRWRRQMMKSIGNPPNQKERDNDD